MEPHGELIDNVDEAESVLSHRALTFFAAPSSLLVLRERIVPLLRTYPSINIWHPACGSGEEVYGIAIILYEEGLFNRSRIYATDRDPTVLAVGREGRYPAALSEANTAAYKAAGGRSDLREYFIADRGDGRLRPDISERVFFAEHNLVTDASFNEFHLIMCRDVIAQLPTPVQPRTYQLLYDSLNLFGVLMLGSRDSPAPPPPQDGYRVVSADDRLYRRVRQ